jgi:hypothetical protein
MTNSVRLVNAGRFSDPAAANLFYVSKVSDWNSYENLEYPGYRGPWTQGFVSIERLTPEHIYRPLPQAVIDEIISEFRKVAMAAPLLTNITFFTCSGIANCDLFIVQITKACEQAGFVVRIEPIREQPIFVSLPRPKTAICRVVSGNYSSQFAAQINRALSPAVEFSDRGFFLGWRLPPTAIEITIAGFPTFGAGGRATFDP